MTDAQENNAWQEITAFDEPTVIKPDAPLSSSLLKGRFVCRYTIRKQRTYPLGTAYFATMRLTQGRKRFETIDRAIRQIRIREDFNRNFVFLYIEKTFRSYFSFLPFFSPPRPPRTSDLGLHIQKKGRSYIPTASCIMKYINLAAIYPWFISYICHKWSR